MIRAPIKKGETPFQPVTTTVSTRAKYTASLSSIYVARKPSLVTTDYIHPRVEISDRYFINVMYGGVNQIIILVNKFLELSRSCHKYFFRTGKLFVMNCY